MDNIHELVGSLDYNMESTNKSQMEMLEMLSKISYTKIIFFGFINRLDTLDTESETL